MIPNGVNVNIRKLRLMVNISLTQDFDLQNLFAFIYVSTVSTSKTMDETRQNCENKT